MITPSEFEIEFFKNREFTPQSKWAVMFAYREQYRQWIKTINNHENKKQKTQKKHYD